ncbi:MAG: hypothetical protein AVDCRST_MAG17-983, partial [uncultured Solirubrobacterales bacterium]
RASSRSRRASGWRRFRSPPLTRRASSPPPMEPSTVPSGPERTGSGRPSRRGAPGLAATLPARRGGGPTS